MSDEQPCGDVITLDYFHQCCRPRGHDGLHRSPGALGRTWNAWDELPPDLAAKAKARVEAEQASRAGEFDGGPTVDLTDYLLAKTERGAEILAESVRLREQAEKAEAEVERLQALVKRMAPAASSYNARIYQVGFEPDIAQYLTEEEIRLNSERPSAADDRARYDAVRLREQLEAVRAACQGPRFWFNDGVMSIEMVPIADVLAILEAK